MSKIYKQSEIRALYDENQRLRAATGQPLRPEPPPVFCFQSAAKNLLVENAKMKLPSTPNIDRMIASRNASKTNQPNDFEIMGMSQEAVLRIADDVAKNPSKYPGPNPVAKAVLAAGLAEIRQREKPSAPAKPAQACPAAAAPVKPAPAQTAATTPPASAQSIASALLDEQDRRAAAALHKTRDEFTKLSPAAAMKFIKAGGKISN